MRIAIYGANGRMGKALVNAAREHSQLELLSALVEPQSPDIGKDSGEFAGSGSNGIVFVDDVISGLENCDGIIDFTIPQASLNLLNETSKRGIVHVIGTTGFTPEEETILAEAGKKAKIVKSGNMSLGVNLLSALVKKVAASLDESFDIEILEMHHRHKIDAPSGTAYLLGEAAAKGRGVDLEKRAVKAREGQTGARIAGDIGFATLRGGSVIGEHSVIFAGASERLELTHKAEDRGIFAQGALKAALWAKDQKAGYYSMMDVLGL